MPWSIWVRVSVRHAKTPIASPAFAVSMAQAASGNVSEWTSVRVYFHTFINECQQTVHLRQYLLIWTHTHEYWSEKMWFLVLFSSVITQASSKLPCTREHRSTLNRCIENCWAEYDALNYLDYESCGDNCNEQFQVEVGVCKKRRQLRKGPFWSYCESLLLRWIQKFAVHVTNGPSVLMLATHSNVSAPMVSLAMAHPVSMLMNVAMVPLINVIPCRNALILMAHTNVSILLKNMLCWHSTATARTSARIPFKMNGPPLHA